MAGSETEITMPQMGAEMEEGTLLRWLKHPGDAVARGEVIAEIETDKANIEIESFEAGVLQETLVEEGQVVPVGDVIARIATGGGSGVASAPAAEPSPAVAAAPPPAQPQEARADAPGNAARTDQMSVGSPTAPAAEVAEPSPALAPATEATQPAQAESGRRLRASPVARAMAAERGVDLGRLSGSGPDGRIVRRDVERAADNRDDAPRSPVPAPRTPVTRPSTAAEPQVAPPGIVPLSRMRSAIARAMSQSKRDVPHYYVTIEVDMTEAMQFRASVNAAAGESGHVSVNDLIVKASALVLGRFPRFNASYADTGAGGGVRMNDRINICIAVAVADGLVAPALLNAGDMSLGAVARAAADLASRARNGGLKPPELSDGTFTISNLGMYGIETLIPIIQPPQSAVLGIGAAQDKPAVRDGQIVIRKLMIVALAADHRVTNGAEGGEFLRDLKRVLEQPVGLAL